MPTTLAAILIAIFAIFPGIAGNVVYSLLVGADPTEKDWASWLRILGFSIVGICLYALISPEFGWPEPAYIAPSFIADYKAISFSVIRPLLLAYLGHFAASGIAGFLGAWSLKTFAFLVRGSAYPGAWDELVRIYVAKHWVVITLKSDEVYAGILKSANTSVPANGRDVILAEPALYDKRRKEYIATPYQYLFLTADAIYSIAVVHDPRRDTRLTVVGASIFPKGDGR